MTRFGLRNSRTAWRSATAAPPGAQATRPVRTSPSAGTSYRRNRGRSGWWRGCEGGSWIALPLVASPKRSLTLTSGGPDTPLVSLPIGLKSFEDGQAWTCIPAQRCPWSMTALRMSSASRSGALQTRRSHDGWPRRVAGWRTIDRCQTLICINSAPLRCAQPRFHRDKIATAGVQEGIGHENYESRAIHQSKPGRLRP